MNEFVVCFRQNDFFFVRCVMARILVRVGGGVWTTIMDSLPHTWIGGWAVWWHLCYFVLWLLRLWDWRWRSFLILAVTKAATDQKNGADTAAYWKRKQNWLKLYVQKQVTRGHNIVADGWAGASNLHPYPVTPNKHTQKVSKTLVIPLFHSMTSDRHTDGWTNGRTKPLMKLRVQEATML